MTHGGPLELTDQNFPAEVLAGEGLMLVDFHATWCGPCRVISPVVDALAREHAGRLKVGKVDVDANPETAARYGVRAVPTILIFRHGVVIDRVVGAAPRAKLEAMVNHAIEEGSHAVSA